MATVKQSGGDYATLAAACAAGETTISIEGTWTVDDTAAVTIDTDNTTITCDSDSAHPGYWDESTNHYRLVCSSGSHCITLNGAYTATIDGLAIEQASTTSSAEGIRAEPGTSDTVTIKNCLIQCSTNTTDQDCIYTGHNKSIGTVVVEQCMIWGANRAGIHMQNARTVTTSTGSVKVNSCTIWDCGKGADDSGGIRWHAAENGGGGLNIDVYNTICVGNDGGTGCKDFKEFLFSSGTAPASWDVSYSIDSDGSISSDTDGGTGNLANKTPTDSGSPSANSVVFEDITSSPYDLRLVSHANNDAEDMHTASSAHGLTLPTTDIVGTTRASSYECGAFSLAVTTFTGSATPSTGGTTSAASGTFTAPVYTGSATTSVGSATAAASGTHTAPIYTGSSAPSSGSATSAASGTFAVPVYTGSSTPSIGAATAAASGTFAPAAGTYTGSSTITVGSVTSAASGTTAEFDGTATAPLQTAAVQIVAYGQFSVPAIAYYKTTFDDEYTASKSLYDNAANSGRGEQYYTMQFILSPTLSMYEATGDTTYLDRALAWMDTMISKATIIDIHGKKNWAGNWGSPWAGPDIAFALDEQQACTELARACQIITRDPALLATYSTEVDDIYEHVLTHYIEKQLWDRSGLSWFYTKASDSNAVWSDKTSLLITGMTSMIEANKVLGYNDRAQNDYPDIVEDLIDYFTPRLVAPGSDPACDCFGSGSDGLIWDCGLNNYQIPNIAMDTSHANREPVMVARLYDVKHPSVSLTHVNGLAELLNDIIWDGSHSSPRFTNHIDGDNQSNLGRGPWELGSVYGGWVTLSKYNAQTFQVMDSTLRAIINGVSNESLDRMDNQWGRSALSGHLALAVTFDQTQQADINVGAATASASGTFTAPPAGVRTIGSTGAHHTTFADWLTYIQGLGPGTHQASIVTNLAAGLTVTGLSAGTWDLEIRGNATGRHKREIPFIDLNDADINDVTIEDLSFVGAVADQLVDTTGISGNFAIRRCMFSGYTSAGIQLTNTNAGTHQIENCIATGGNAASTRGIDLGGATAGTWTVANCLSVKNADNFYNTSASGVTKKYYNCVAMDSGAGTDFTCSGSAGTDELHNCVMEDASTDANWSTKNTLSYSNADTHRYFELYRQEKFGPQDWVERLWGIAGDAVNTPADDFESTTRTADTIGPFDRGGTMITWTKSTVGNAASGATYASNTDPLQEWATAVSALAAGFYEAEIISDINCTVAIQMANPPKVLWMHGDQTGATKRVLTVNSNTQGIRFVNTDQVKFAKISDVALNGSGQTDGLKDLILLNSTSCPDGVRLERVIGYNGTDNFIDSNSTDSTEILVKNCVGYDNSGAAVNISTASNAYHDVVNCGAYQNGTHGFEVGNSASIVVDFTNCVAMDCVDGFDTGATLATTNLYNCVSSDASANSANHDTTTNCADSKTDYTNYFNDWANNDFTLKDDDASLWGINGDDSQAPFADVAGTVRRSTNSDLGPYEFEIAIATMAATTGPAVAAASGTFVHGFSATAAAAVGSPALSGSATFSAPVFTGSSAATPGGAMAAGSGQYGHITFEGTAGLALGSPSASGSATFLAIPDTGSASLVLSSAGLTASGDFTGPAPSTYTGSASVVAPGATLSASGIFIHPDTLDPDQEGVAVMATRQNFIGYRGDAFQQFDIAVKKNGIALPLTDYSINMTWRRGSKTGMLLAQKVIGNGITVDDENGGLFHVDPFAPSPAWPVGTHWYDIEIVKDGLPLTIVIGNWQLQQDVGGA